MMESPSSALSKGTYLGYRSGLLLMEDLIIGHGSWSMEFGCIVGVGLSLEFYPTSVVVHCIGRRSWSFRYGICGPG